MLPLILALMSDPAVTITTPAPTLRPLAGAEAQAPRLFTPAARPRCENAQIQNAGPVTPDEAPRPIMSDLMHRSGDVVRMDLLLERRIDGCAAPLSFTINTFG
ncbi:MAG: hypothetical protein EON87_22310, partial [Brevundimonas sp.]